MEEVYINGSVDQRIPGIFNVSFNFVEGESLIMSLSDLAVSSGSACTSASLEPSYVLRALGRNDELAHSSLRFSIGRFTTEEDVDLAIEKVRAAVENYVNCRRFGICIKMALISIASSGQRTKVRL